MKTLFAITAMVIIVVVSLEGDVMPPHFLEPGVRLNADGYIDVLTNVKPWMDAKANGRDFMLQYDSAPAHKAKKTQAWLNTIRNEPHQSTPG